MSAKKFARWMWLDEVEPFGSLRDDYRTAQTVAMVHNVAVKSEHQKRPSHFLLKFVQTDAVRSAEPAKKQTVEEQIRILTIIAHAFAGAPKKEPA